MRRKLLTYLFLVNLLIAIPVITLEIIGYPNLLIQLTLTTVIQAIMSYFIIKENLKNYNIDLLFILSTLSTYFVSVYGILIQEKPYFHVTAILATVYYLTKLIEEKTYEGLKKNFSDMYKILPKRVKVLRNDKEKVVLIRNLVEGDVVIIGPGKKIPIDGMIVSGSSCIDESMITGENLGIEKRSNDRVIAGTITVDGLIKVKVEKTGKDTYLSQIIELIENVEESKTRNKRLIRKAYKFFMLTIILSSIFTFIVWQLIGNSTYLSFKRAATVLIISSNASLVLATPIALIFSVMTLTKKGIVIRNPRSVEILPEIRTYVFDKTGTLTEGKTEVKEIIPLNGSNIEEITRYFLIAEKHSSHPIAKMVCRQLKRGRRIPDPDYLKEYSGMGVYAKYKDKKIHIGGEKFMDLFNIKEGLEKLENEVVVCKDRKPIGLIKIEDTLKRSSKELIQFLKEKNREIIILTGDKRKNAEKIGKELGIEKIFSEIVPEKKLEIIKNLRENGPLVMIGDGINDAPSLAQADVGISINNDLDLVGESADIMLIKDDLALVKKLIKISEFTKTKVKQNLFWTYSYNIIAVIIASGALISLGLNISPLLACAASISSTISIMINSFLFR